MLRLSGARFRPGAFNIVAVISYLEVIKQAEPVYRFRLMSL